MKTTGITATALCLIGLICLGTGLVEATQSFRDEFTNPDPTNPNRDPVTWTAFFGSSIAIENGNLVIGQASSAATLGFAYVDGFSAQDATIEAQFQILEGTNAGIGFGNSDTLDGFGGNLTTSDNPFFPRHAELIRGSAESFPQSLLTLIPRTKMSSCDCRSLAIN